MNPSVDSVDSYINNFPETTREILATIRKIILENAPDASEEIAYGMPAYKTHKKPLVYYAVFAKHIGFYATPTGHAHFAKQLAGYKQGKGSVQFPLNQPIPYEMIAEIVRFRVAENESKSKK